MEILISRIFLTYINKERFATGTGDRWSVQVLSEHVHGKGILQQGISASDSMENRRVHRDPYHCRLEWEMDSPAMQVDVPRSNVHHCI